MHNSNQRTIFNDVNLIVLPLAASADASPAPTTRAQSKKADAANKTPAALWTLCALNQMILSCAMSGACRAHVDMTRMRVRMRKPHKGTGGRAPAA